MSLCTENKQTKQLDYLYVTQVIEFAGVFFLFVFVLPQAVTAGSQSTEQHLLVLFTISCYIQGYSINMDLICLKESTDRFYFFLNCFIYAHKHVIIKQEKTMATIESDYNPYGHSPD